MDAASRIACLAVRVFATLAAATIAATGWDAASRDHAARLADDLAAMTR